MKKRILLRLIILLLLFLLITSNANTRNTETTIWYVHPDSTLNAIQAGIDSCSTGDTVLVEIGTYYENINFKGKAITVTSVLGADSTIIDGGNPANPDSGSVVVFVSGEDTNSVLDGFTIRDGSGTYVFPWGRLGGGIYSYYSSPYIKNNTIINNETDHWGGGICCYFSSPIIYGNTINCNHAFLEGGGINCFYSSPTIVNNQISYNWAHFLDWGNAGGISCDNSSPNINNNIITNNRSWEAGGIGCYSSSPIISNNIISENNVSLSGGGIECNSSSPTIIGNTISNNKGDREGGGIFLYRNCSPIITGNIITGNVTYGFGGGIFCRDSCYPVISNNTITSNSASNEFEPSGCGGGIYCEYYSSPRISSNIITNNKADSVGSGILCHLHSSPFIDSCAILDNNGDGIYCSDSSQPIINYNNIKNNTGYGVLNVDSTITINALFNWWGDSSGPGGEGPGIGDEVSKWVAYIPWLTDSVCGVEEETFDEKFSIINKINPNPFTYRTQIEYQLPKSSNVNISIYNTLGARIRVLLNERQNAGEHTITWDGRYENGNKLPGGFYFLRLETDGNRETRKLLLLK